MPANTGSPRSRSTCCQLSPTERDRSAPCMEWSHLHRELLRNAARHSQEVVLVARSRAEVERDRMNSERASVEGLAGDRQIARSLLLNRNSDSQTIANREVYTRHGGSEEAAHLE